MLAVSYDNDFIKLQSYALSLKGLQFEQIINDFNVIQRSIGFYTNS